MTETKTRRRFLPTIDLWANGGVMQDAIISGQLQLIPGQWVQCGSGPKSRFVCIRGTGPTARLWIVHPEGDPDSPTITRERFSNVCALWQGRIDRDEFKKRRKQEKQNAAA